MLDAFKVSILVKVTNEASAVLGILNRDFAKSEAAAKRLSAAMKDLKVAAGLGAVAGGMAYGLEKALKPAMEYQHQLTLMKNNLNDQKELAKAVGAAWQTSKEVLTSTPTENLKVLAETKFAFGNLDSAVKNLPKFMQMNAILASVMGKDGADQAFSGARLQELRGSVRSDDEFTRQMEAMVRTTQATGGRVGPDQFLAFAKMAAPFTTRFSDQFLYNQAPTMMQDMGAERAGTALNTLLQAVVGGRMTKASFATAQQAGLIDNDAKYRVGAAGTIQLEKRQWHGADVAQQNPLQWVQQYLMPALSNLPEKDRGLFLTQLFSNRNAQRAANDFLTNGWRYLKDEAQTLKPTGIQSMSSLLNGDPATAQAAAAAQWNKLWTQIGIDIVPRLIPLITKLAEGLDRLTGIAQRHPDVAKLGIGLGIVATGLLGLASAVNIISAALKLSGIAGAMGASGGMGRAAMFGLGGGTALGVAGAAAAGGAMAYGAGQMFPGMGRAEANFKMWVDHMMTGSGYTPLPRPGSNSGDTTVNLNVDGQKITSVVINRMGRAMNGPNQGFSGFDGKRGYTPPAY